MAGKKVFQNRFADLRERARSLLAKQKKSVSVPRPEEMAALVEEFNTYQIELELQNEELRQTQMELDKSQRKYQALYDFAPTGYLTLNDKSVITEVNLTAAEMLGLERRLITQQPISAFIEPDDQDIYYHHHKKLIESKEKQFCQLRMRSRTGTVLYCQLQYIVHEGEDSDSVKIFVSLTDVSRLHKIEMQIKVSEQKFRTVADYTYDWEYWIGPDGKLQYTSPSCKRITGYTVEEFMENPELLLSIAHKDDQPLLTQHLSVELTSRDAQHLDYRIQTRQGDTRWISHCCQPIYDEFGKFCGRRASMRDITARKELEQKLKESESLMRAALDASSDGMWDRNLLTNEVYYGENWYKSLGFTLEDARENDLQWQDLIHPEDKPIALQALQDHINGKNSVYNVEFRMQNKEGKWQWFLSRGKVLEFDESGKPIRMVGTHKDITDRKCYELRLQKANDDLESKVRQRTIELEETNIALKILLKKRMEDKSSQERHILNTFAMLVEPYLIKLKNSNLNSDQQQIVTILETNFEEIFSSFESSFAAHLMKLTPSESQVANLVKLGKQTKEIAQLLNLSPATISVYRKNIRKKLNLKNKNINLQTALATQDRIDAPDLYKK